MKKPQPRDKKWEQQKTEARAAATALGHKLGSFFVVTEREPQRMAQCSQCIEHVLLYPYHTPARNGGRLLFGRATQVPCDNTLK